MVMDPNGPLIGYAWFEQLEAENARLKTEVERLRKAGDALAETLEGAGFDSAMDFWNAAKEGKKP